MSDNSNQPRYSRRKMVKVSYLYYKRNMNQKEIAEMLDVSTITISRILDAAKRNGVVEFKIKYEYGRNSVVEEKAKQAFPSVRFIAYEDDFLTETSRQGKPVVPQYLGEAFSSQFETFIPEDSVLGIGGGKTVSALVEHLNEEDTPSLKEAVQLTGSFGEEVISQNSASVIHKLCDKLDIPGTFLLSPAVQKEPMNSTSNYNTSIQEKWKKLDTAIMGIGELSDTATVMETDLLSKEDLGTLAEKGAVGNIGLHFYDSEGELVDLELESRIAGISWKQLEKTDRVILIAGGESKNEAIRGALNSNLVDVMVTLVSNLEYVLNTRETRFS